LAAASDSTRLIIQGGGRIAGLVAVKQTICSDKTIYIYGLRKLKRLQKPTIAKQL
jgi:hypothetical protein